MGACSFQTSSYGKTINEAYRNACDEAREEYGNDPYNGTISTTHGFRDVTADFKRSGLSLNEYIVKHIGNLNKRDVWGICVKEPVVNKNKVKSKVEHIVSKGTKKWVLKYVVEERFSGNFVASERTKGAAVTKARKHCEATQTTCTIRMTKELEKGNAMVATVEYKKATNESNGKYVFFGWAAE